MTICIKKIAWEIMHYRPVTLCHIEEFLDQLKILDLLSDDMNASTSIFPVPGFARDSLEAQAKYGKFIEQQELELKALRDTQETVIPINIEYTRENLPGLSFEEVS